jgi:transposase InsO family protein
LITALSDEHSITTLCEVLSASRSAYYAFVNGLTYQPSASRLVLLKEVKLIFDFHKKRYGSRRIREELKDKGYPIGKYKVSSLMKELELKAIQPKSFVPRTTQSDARLHRFPNLLLEEANLPCEPDEVVVGDITYLPSVDERGLEQWLFLAIWMDLFTRKIVGWYVDDNMEAVLVIKAMKRFIYNRSPSSKVIVHTDGGRQYGSDDFKNLIAPHQFRQSMTRKNNHYDNAFAESLFSRFKAEVLSEGIFLGLGNARKRCFEYIEAYYNTIRKHSSIDYLSPSQFEDQYWMDLLYRKK